MAAAIRAEKKEREMAGCTRKVSRKLFRRQGLQVQILEPVHRRFVSTNPGTLLHSGFVSTNPGTRSPGLDEDRKWEVRVKDGAGSIFGKGGSKDETRRGD